MNFGPSIMSGVPAVIIADPRCFAPSSANPYIGVAQQWINQTSAAQRGEACPELAECYRLALEGSCDAEIAGSLRAATSPAVYRCLWASLIQALEGGERGNSAPVARLFAMPVLVVTGGRANITVPGVLRDIARVRDVLEQHGALGPVRNFGLSNTLCSLEAMERVSLGRVYAFGQGLMGPGFDRMGAATADLVGLDLPPSDLDVTSADEQVHLRFLAGAAVTAADAPSFLETGADIGAWGMPLTRELAGQLGREGLSILPIARPPHSWLNAQVVGWRAREELSLQAFVSRVLRRFRGEIGEPKATIAALDGGTIALRFGSPFVEGRVYIHHWTPHWLDDVNEIALAMLSLLRECRVDNVDVLPTLVPEAVFAVSAAGSGAH